MQLKTSFIFLSRTFFFAARYFHRSISIDHFNHLVNFHKTYIFQVLRAQQRKNLFFFIIIVLIDQFYTFSLNIHCLQSEWEWEKEVFVVFFLRKNSCICLFSRSIYWTVVPLSSSSANKSNFNFNYGQNYASPCSKRSVPRSIPLMWLMQQHNTKKIEHNKKVLKKPHSIWWWWRPVTLWLLKMQCEKSTSEWAHSSAWTISSIKGHFWCL